MDTKVLFVGPWSLLDLFRQMMEKLNCAEVMFCNWNNGWDDDPLDKFLDEEPTHVIYVYQMGVNAELGSEKEEHHFVQMWKNLVAAADDGQKIYRVGFVRARDIQMIAEGQSVRERTSPDEIPSDFVRLPIMPDDLKQLLE